MELEGVKMSDWKEKYVAFYERRIQLIQMLLWGLFFANVIFGIPLTDVAVLGFVTMSIVYFVCQKRYAQIVIYLLLVAVLFLAPRWIRL